MTSILKLASLVTLGLVIVPCVLYFAGMIGLGTVKGTALVGTIGWFIATPLWMGRGLPVDATEAKI